MENESDRCYFCGTLSQYNFGMQTSVCTDHWNMMYRIKVPSHIDPSQITNYRKLALEKRIWKV